MMLAFTFLSFLSVGTEFSSACVLTSFQLSLKFPAPTMLNALLTSILRKASAGTPNVWSVLITLIAAPMKTATVIVPKLGWSVHLLIVILFLGSLGHNCRCFLCHSLRF